MQGNEEEELSIVLLGPVGGGKSRSGNNILGKCDAFKSKPIGGHVTKTCTSENAVRNGRKLVVIDTPGISAEESENAKQLIKNSIHKAEPGPNAVILCFDMCRTNSVEFKTTHDQCLHFFGEEMFQYAMVLFTNLDGWKKRYEDDSGKEAEDMDVTKEFIASLPKHGKILVGKCKGGYVTINNLCTDEERMDEQIFTIMKKIEDLGAIKAYNERHFIKKEVTEKSLPRYRKIRRAGNFVAIVGGIGAFMYFSYKFGKPIVTRILESKIVCLNLNVFDIRHL